MKSFILILLFQCVIVIVISQPTKKLTDINNKSNAHYGAHSYSSTSKSKPQSCRTNQYFDVDKGQCLTVFGGGKVLYINNTRSCGTNVLKPHCTDPRYYYMCKEDKTILMQCPQYRHFESRLQKCVLVSPEEYSHAQLNSNVPDAAKHFVCHKQGSYPVPNNCGLFYTCTKFAYRMYQNFYTCPKNMVYDVDMEMCKPSSTCQQSKPPLCSNNNGKENMTLEEAEKPMHPAKMTPIRDNGKMCETIFTNDEDYNDDEIISTTASYTESAVSQLPGTSDSNAIVITTERASEMSRSTNTDDSAMYTTEMYPTSPKETMLNHEGNSPTEMGRNEESEFTTSSRSMEEEHNTIATSIDEQSTTEIRDISSTPLGLDDPTTSSTNAEQTSTEKNSCESCLETTTATEPDMEEQHAKIASSTIGQQITTTAASAISADPTPSSTETEMPTNTEGSPSEIIATGEPDIEQQHTTVASTIGQEITTAAASVTSADPTPSSTDTEMQTNTEGRPSITTGKPDIEQRHTTVASTIGRLITTAASATSADPTASNADTEMQTNTEERPSEIVTTEEPDIEQRHTTVASTIGRLITTAASATLADPTASNTETEMQTNTEGRPSKIVTTEEPDIEQRHTTIGQEITTAAATPISADPTTPSSTETEGQRSTETSSTAESSEMNTTKDPISEEQRDATPENENSRSTSTELESTDVPAAISDDPTTPGNQEAKEERDAELGSGEPPLESATTEEPNAKEEYATNTAAKIIQQPTTNILSDSTTPGYAETEAQTPTETIPTGLSLKDSSNEKPDLEEQNISTTEKSKEESTTEIGTTDVTSTISTTVMENKEITDRNEESEHDDRGTDEQEPVDYTSTISPTTESGNEDTMLGSTTHNTLDGAKITEPPSLVSTDGEPVLRDDNTTENNIEETSTRTSNNDAPENTDMIFTDSVTNSVDNFTPPSNNVSTDSIFARDDASNPTTVSASSTVDNVNDVSESSTLPEPSESNTKENTFNENEENNTLSTTESNIMETDFPEEANTMFTTPDNSNLDNVEHVTEGFTPSTDTSINEAGKSVSQEDGLSTTSTTKEMNTDNTSNKTTSPSKSNFINKKSQIQSFYKHLHSWIADKKNAFHQNKSIVEKGSVNIILSIASAVLNIADKLKRHIQRILTGILH